MSISFGSISTGLPKDIVKQIITAERVPIDRMMVRKEKLDEKKKLVQELNKLVNQVRTELLKNSNMKSLRELKVLTNNDIVDVTVDKEIADPAEYRFEVDKLAQNSAAMTSGFSDPDKSYIGVGYIRYNLPTGESRSIYIDAENASLRGVEKLINADPHATMRANIVNDGSGSDQPWRLVLSLKRTGDDENAEFPYFYFVDGDDDFYLEFEKAAHDAQMKFDSFEIEKPENHVKDLIKGATIDLKKAAPGEEFFIKIVEDYKAISEKINTIVKNINEVLTFINKQNQLDEKSDTSKTLGGDVSIQTIESKLRSTILEPYMTEEGQKHASNLGINFQRDGTLKVDEKKLEAETNRSFRVWAQMLTDYTDHDGARHIGLINKLANVIGGIVRSPDGTLHLRNQGLDSNIKQLDRQISDRERVIERREQMLKDRFSRLESTMNNIKSQGAGLAALGQQIDPITQLAGQ